MVFKKLFLLFSFSSFCLTSYAGTFTLQVKRPNHSIFMREKKEFVEIRPNASLHWGFKLSGDFFYIEYGGKIADTNYGKSSVGNNSYRSYRIGIPIKNTYTEIYYQEWIGFSSNENNDTGCEYCLERETFSSRDRSAYFTYALDSQFSMKALTSNGSEGVKLGGSYLISLFYDRLKVRDSGGLLQGDSNSRLSFFSNIDSLEMEQYGLAVGYGYLLPLSYFYFGFSGLAGLGYQTNRRTFLDGGSSTFKDVGTHWSVKLMLATHNKGINFGLKGYLFSNIYRVEDSKNLASLNYNVYLYTSYSW